MNRSGNSNIHGNSIRKGNNSNSSNTISINSTVSRDNNNKGFVTLTKIFPTALEGGKKENTKYQTAARK